MESAGIKPNKTKVNKRLVIFVVIIIGAFVYNPIVDSLTLLSDANSASIPIKI